jgi:hypothetical protein
MDFMVLKKKIDGYRAANGQIKNVPGEILLELRAAWEQFTGPAEQFRRELRIKTGTLRKLLIDSKKLNHVLASAEAVGLNGSPSEQPPQAELQQNGPELLYDHGDKIIRFPNVDSLLEFMRKTA